MVEAGSPEQVKKQVQEQELRDQNREQKLPLDPKQF